MSRAFLCAALLSAVSLVYAGGGLGISFGYQFTDVDAAKDALDTMFASSGTPSNTNEMVFDIHGYGVVTNFLRLGGFISGGYWDFSGTPSPQVMRETSAGAGFGNVRLGFLPEFYRVFGQLDVSLGLGLGFGTTITFVDDDNGDNDGEKNLYGLIRPQLSVSYCLTDWLAFQVCGGVNLPLFGQDGKFWFINSSGDTLTYSFKPADMSGIFVKAGVCFGQMNTGGY